MNEEKLRQFINNEPMARAVYDALLHRFIRKETADIYVLAASKIAINLLQEVWKELEALKNGVEEDKKEVGNIGM